LKLLIEAATKEYKDDIKFRKFRRQVLHSSLAQLLSTLKPGMTKPEVKRCPDGHFRRVIYGIGPYIADYPEQVFLSCCVSGWCPKYVFLFFDFIASNGDITRCTAHYTDLDGEGGRRTREHTELLVRELELGVLWDEYSLVGDVVVSTTAVSVFLHSRR
jgi:Plavaka transposase